MCWLGDWIYHRGIELSLRDYQSCILYMVLNHCFAKHEVLLMIGLLSILVIVGEMVFSWVRMVSWGYSYRAV